MTFKHIIKEMHNLLEHICQDLKKSEKGNKAASQRVRTRSIKLAKVAKKYRKESVSEEKKNLKIAAKKRKKKKAISKKTSKKKTPSKAKKSSAKRKKKKIN